ncbi:MULTISPECIES: hypothetical protein [unclassified Mycoplasma]|uniref:hypothetical protein n=1 Tax=unclassified Mycoplasma TaxID=2683645 RepID=UPI00211C728C|nr:MULTISPECIES: hypothetical protein [unclassified Mycoplasma]UUM19933.1 hypothetical protein NPA11_00635 [Mycoplasma sp. 1578d]UUM24914.1 hypothetical protein NPA12_00620 [Mycoplasma sp. 3686d]
MKRNRILKNLFMLGTPASLLIATVSCSSSTTQQTTSPKPVENNTKPAAKTTEETKALTPVTEQSGKPTPEKAPTPNPTTTNKKTEGTSAQTGSSSTPVPATSQPSTTQKQGESSTTSSNTKVSKDNASTSTTRQPTSTTSTSTPSSPASTTTPATPAPSAPTTSKTVVNTLTKEMEEEVNKLDLLKRVNTDADFKSYFLSLRKPKPNNNITKTYTREDFLADVWILQNAFAQVLELEKALKANDDEVLNKFIADTKDRLNSIFKEAKDKDNKAKVSLDTERINNLYKTVSLKLTNSIPNFVLIPGFGFISGSFNNGTNPQAEPTEKAEVEKIDVNKLAHKIVQKLESEKNSKASSSSAVAPAKPASK